MSANEPPADPLTRGIAILTQVAETGQALTAEQYRDLFDHIQAGQRREEALQAAGAALMVQQQQLQLEAMVATQRAQTELLELRNQQAAVAAAATSPQPLNAPRAEAAKLGPLKPRGLMEIAAV